MASATSEQLEALHHLINEASNTATAIAESLSLLGDLDKEAPEQEMLVRVHTTKALRIRDALQLILDFVNDDHS